MEKIFQNTWQRNPELNSNRKVVSDKISCIHRIKAVNCTPEEEKALRESGFENDIMGKSLVSPKDMSLKQAKEILETIATSDTKEPESAK